MKCQGIIKKIAVKMDADTNILTEITMSVNGDVAELKSLMKKPIELVMETMQMEFGIGKAPNDKNTHGGKNEKK